MMFREQIKWLFFPGLNLNARLRFRVLPKFFGRPKPGEQRLVLDAGCGNGMLSYQAYRMGNKVLGVSIKDEVVRDKKFFNEYHGIADDRLEFRDHNLYDIDKIGVQFDEIICCEVMEHIKGDEQVCRHFYKILKPGGVLHICCPNPVHPINANYPLDPNETGGHVRPGYTYEGFKALLEPIGFQLSAPIGLGGPIRQACNTQITNIQLVGGLKLGIPLFFMLAPFALLDGSNPKVPFSIYVRATKPQN